MTEVHPNPEEAWSDGPQSLRFEDFAAMMQELQPYVKLRKSELN
jgi:3-deoxy-7-phosphoheptulonate synthase